MKGGGCTGCLLTQQEYQQLISKREKEAKERAIIEQKNFVLYESGTQEVLYMEWEAARQIGITPIKFVTFMQERNNGGVS